MPLKTAALSVGGGGTVLAMSDTGEDQYKLCLTAYTAQAQILACDGAGDAEEDGMQGRLMEMEERLRMKKQMAAARKMQAEESSQRIDEARRKVEAERARADFVARESSFLEEEGSRILRRVRELLSEKESLAKQISAVNEELDTSYNKLGEIDHKTRVLNNGSASETCGEQRALPRPAPKTWSVRLEELGPRIEAPALCMDVQTCLEKDDYKTAWSIVKRSVAEMKMMDMEFEKDLRQVQSAKRNIRDRSKVFQQKIASIEQSIDRCRSNLSMATLDLDGNSGTVRQVQESSTSLPAERAPEKNSQALPCKDQELSPGQDKGPEPEGDIRGNAKETPSNYARPAVSADRNEWFKNLRRSSTNVSVVSEGRRSDENRCQSNVNTPMDEDLGKGAEVHQTTKATAPVVKSIQQLLAEVRNRREQQQQQPDYDGKSSSNSAATKCNIDQAQTSLPLHARSANPSRSDASSPSPSCAANGRMPPSHAPSGTTNHRSSSASRVSAVGAGFHAAQLRQQLEQNHGSRHGNTDHYDQMKNACPDKDDEEFGNDFYGYEAERTLTQGGRAPLGASEEPYLRGFVSPPQKPRQMTPRSSSADLSFDFTSMDFYREKSSSFKDLSDNVRSEQKLESSPVNMTSPPPASKSQSNNKKTRASKKEGSKDSSQTRVAEGKRSAKTAAGKEKDRASGSAGKKGEKTTSKTRQDKGDVAADDKKASAKDDAKGKTRAGHSVYSRHMEEPEDTCQPEDLSRPPPKPPRLYTYTPPGQGDLNPKMALTSIAETSHEEAGYFGSEEEDPQDRTNSCSNAQMAALAGASFGGKARAGEESEDEDEEGGENTSHSGSSISFDGEPSASPDKVKVGANAKKKISHFIKAVRNKINKNGGTCQ